MIARFLTARGPLGVRVPMLILFILLLTGALTGDAGWVVAGLIYGVAVCLVTFVAAAILRRRERLYILRSLERTDPRLDPEERRLPMDVQVSAEEAINSSFGLPEVWRCPCGGRPFITELKCPRCDRPQGARWA